MLIRKCDNAYIIKLDWLNANAKCNYADMLNAIMLIRNYAYAKYMNKAYAKCNYAD